METVKYYRKDVFGMERLYIADTIKADAFLTLTGNKTITPDQYKALKTLGLLLEDITEIKS